MKALEMAMAVFRGRMSRERVQLPLTNAGTRCDLPESNLEL